MEKEQLKKLYNIMTENGFDEIELSLAPQNRIRLVRDIDHSTHGLEAPSMLKNNLVEKQTVEDSKNSELNTDAKMDAIKKDNIFEIHSEVVGKYMLRDEETFLKEGDTVVKGDNLGTIFTLNSSKFVKCPCNGVIEKIWVKQDCFVDYGRLLFTIKKLD